MIETMNAWLSLTVLLGLMALFATKSLGGELSRVSAVCTFIIATIASYTLLQAPMGFPDYDALPAGEYRILGARIDVDVAIYVLIDGPEPHLYRLPYTNSDAGKLQQALDATAAGRAGGAMVKNGEESEGEPEFYEAPVQEDAPKAGEQPQMEF